MIRCPICGTSDFPQGQTECVHRHHREGVDREVECEVDAVALAIVLRLSHRLKDYDVSVKQQDGRLILDFDDLDDASLREIVLLLWDNEVPREQIHRLRLDEPEEVSAIVSDGIRLLRTGRGTLTQEFRSHVTHLFETEEGDHAQRASADAALHAEFDVLIAAIATEDENWDETDRRVFEFMRRFPEPQRLPLWALIPRAIGGLEN